MASKTNRTAQAIQANYAEREDRLPESLDCSALGEECERKLWLDFRWVNPEKVGGDRKRLFDFGQREQARILHDLRSIGVELHECEQSTGMALRATDLGGHVSSRVAALAERVPEEPEGRYAVEVGTLSTKSFDKLRDKGVEKARPKEFAKCQMVAALRDTPGALYIGECRETNELHAELVPLNRKKASALREKAERVIFAPNLPRRPKDSAEYPPCSYCHHQRRCYHATPTRPVLPEKTCRSCAHSTPKPDGGWRCERHDRDITTDEQLAACDRHIIHPELLPFGEPLHAEDGFVLYPGNVVNIAGSGTVRTEQR